LFVEKKCQQHNTDSRTEQQISFWRGGAVSPSNTTSSGPRPPSLPRSILIHPAVWPQQIWAENWGNCVHFGPQRGTTPNFQTDRTGQWSDSIGQTSLQTVAQKTISGNSKLTKK